MYPYQQQPPPPPGQQQQRYPPPPGGGAAFHSVTNAMGQMNIHNNPPPPPQQQQQQGYGMAPPPPPGGGGGGASRMVPPRIPPPAGGVAAPPRMMHPLPPGQQLQQQQPQQSHMMMNPHTRTQAPTPPQGMRSMSMGSSVGAGPAGGMSMPGMASGDPMQNAQIDTSIHCPKRFFALTSDCVPQHMGMVHTSKVPLGGMIRPLAPLSSDQEEEGEVDLVQPTAAGIVRCKKCRLYINPFVQWLDSGRRWCCNICSAMNDTPSAYFCHLEQGVSGDRRDKYDRPELCKGIVEYVAPSEYMVRPPQPPAYFFVIDVSASAVQSGVLIDVARGIQQSLDDLPGGRRAQVGIMTYDRSVHYYSLKSGLSSAQMMVVPDLQNLFVPAPDDLLVNLADSREIIDSFLENLPTMFNKSAMGNPMDGSALGPALKAAYTVMKHMGGKMIVCQSTLPSLGAGSLNSNRENPRVIGTPDEVTLLKPSLSWYKDTAIEFSKAQICVELFLFPQAYIDAANLEQLVSTTGGNLHTFVAYSASVDGAKFRSALQHTLTRETALESVMRIRCSRGMRVSNFYGHFYIRGTDLLSLPNCNQDSSFAFDLTHEDNAPLTCSYLTIQSALLYTTCGGERRIRVSTEAVRVTQYTGEYLSGFNVPVSIALLGKQAMKLGLRSGLEQARNRLQTTCVEIVKAAKHHQLQQQQPNDNDSSDALSSNLELLPLYILALIKNVTLRGGTDVHPDERVQAMHTLSGMWWEDIELRIHPDLYALDLSKLTDWGNLTASGEVLMPNKVNLSIERLNSNGLYLLDDGYSFTLWIGNGVSSSNIEAMKELFGISSIEEFHDINVNVQAILMDRLQELSICDSNMLCGRLARLTAELRSRYGANGVKVLTVREGIDEWLEGRLYWNLIEDRTNFAGAGMLSYAEFMQIVISQGQMGPPGGGPQMGSRSGMPHPPGPPGARPPAPNNMMMHGGGPPSGPPPPQQSMMMSGGPPQPTVMQGRTTGGPPPPPQQGVGMQGPPPPQQASIVQGGVRGPPPPQHGSMMAGRTGGPPPAAMPPALSSFGGPPSGSAVQQHAQPPMNTQTQQPSLAHNAPSSFGSVPTPPMGMSQQYQQAPAPTQHYQQPPPPQPPVRRQPPGPQQSQPPPPPGPPRSFGAPPPRPPTY